MKTVVLIVTMALVNCWAHGQNKFVQQLSDVDVISVTVTSTTEYPLSYQGVPIRSAVITGTVRKVVAFWLKNNTLWGKCNCSTLMLSAASRI